LTDGTVPLAVNHPRRRKKTIRPMTVNTCSPMPAPMKTGRLPRRATIHPKFWPKKPVRKLRGKKMVAMMVSCFMTTLSRLETVDR